MALAAIMCVLVACACRLWPTEHQLKYGADWKLVRDGGRRRLAVDNFVRDMRARVNCGDTIGDTALWFLENCVIRQHHRVALGKLPDDTFRLRLDAGRVHFIDRSVAVELNDSRFQALSTCATELGLITGFDEAHELTEIGRELLVVGDLEPEPGVELTEE